MVLRAGRLLEPRIFPARDGTNSVADDFTVVGLLDVRHADRINDSSIKGQSGMAMPDTADVGHLPCIDVRSVPHR
jgi:hypothetical protein